jgi:hypothetical protein
LEFSLGPSDRSAANFSTDIFHRTENVSESHIIIEPSLKDVIIESPVGEKLA